MKWFSTIVMSVVAAGFVTPAAKAIDSAQAKKVYDTAAPSLVAVQYTAEGEYGRKEVIGQGIIIGDEGLIVTSISLFPAQIPDEQMKEFKIIVPGDDEKELDAVFLGRDERGDLAFLKTKEPQKWKSIKFEDVRPGVAETVYSVGLLPKDAGYKPFLTEAFVAATLRGPIPFVMVSPSGLAGIASPVFNAEGKAIGFVQFQQGQNQLLNGATGMANLSAPTRFYVPAYDFLASIADPPKGEPLKLPWLGARLTGLNKQAAEFFDLKTTPTAVVGEVLADTAAAKGGLRAGDKIIKIDGKPLERGDEPDETPRILDRRIECMKVGQEVTLTVVREQGAAPVEVKVTLQETPRRANLAKRYFAEDLGFSVREIVFSDTYQAKLPKDAKGVVASFIRPTSSASTAKLAPGDIVTKLNGEPIESLEKFKADYKAFRESKPKESVVLFVQRQGTTQVIRIEPPQ